MRKALMGVLIAATAATPLAAQDNGWQGRGERHHQRAEGEQRPQREQRQAPQEQRREQYRGQGERQGGWQSRQQVQVQAAPQVQVREQAQARGYRNGGNWGGQGGADAYRQQIEASREANRRVREGMPESYQRQAIRNEQRYEQQVRQDYRRDNRSTWGRNDWPRNGGDYRAYNRDGRDWRQSWNRDWRRDQRYDWQRWRTSHRDIFRAPYYAPYRGYRYNRLSIGIVLDPIFWGQNYWIGDPWEYRLPAAPYGTQWVRYYNDVLLVDVYTGEVVDVIYDFFW